MRKYLYLIGLICFLAKATEAQTSVALSPVPAQQFLSSTGSPLASGCVFTYISGTSTPLATFTDGTGAVQNSNPVILDIGGFGNIWLSNASYRFTIYSSGGVNCSSGVFQRTVDNISAYSIINQAQNLFLSCGTGDPAGAAGEMGCRSDLSNKMRYFSSLWDSVVTETTAATLLNKTLSSPAVNTPTINGPSTGTGVQGSDSRLLTAGTIGPQGFPACADGNGGVTTAGCNLFPGVVYSTSSVSTSGNIANTTMVTAGGAGNTYRVTFNVIVTAGGTSCAGNSTLQIDLNYTDPFGLSSIGHIPAFAPSNGTTTFAQPFSIANNGVVGAAQSQAVTVPDIIIVKPSTSVVYNTLYTPNGSCAPPPSYQITPIVEILK